MGINPMSTLKTTSGQELSLVAHKRRGSVGEFNMKPQLLENRVTTNNDFTMLSDGFKKVFATDRKDQKMVIPIPGYGGHRRGDRSQNYFGKCEPGEIVCTQLKGYWKTPHIGLRCIWRIFLILEGFFVSSPPLKMIKN